MKKLILITICFISLQLYAQGNLQFNQVLTLSYTGSIPAQSTNSLGTLTVPAGKVWKIESGSRVAITGNFFGNVTTARFMLDDFTVIGHKDDPVSYPIWLNEGTYNIYVSHSTGNTVSYKWGLSIIEFNVVP
jgi:hypothetical protein